MEKKAATYLRHVDGLRAVAVLSVILYHFGIRHMPGGYVGVDVFFVISGFLITRLIYEEINETGRFGFGRFYIRRMRRLLPALLVTLLATFMVAYVLLSPRAFDQFGASLAAAVLSVSNILFWSQSGYFDADSHLKPLLHTWSLSVEEQFYLVWPALLWLIAARLAWGKLRIAATLIAIGGLSFLLNHIWVTGKFDAEYRYAIFYLTPFRVYEFVFGAIAVFLLPWVRDRMVLQEAMMIVGLALIGYSVATFDETIIFPYLNALIPCLGALLVILSGQSRIAGALITNPAAVGIGLISYSLYLVHWPVIVFYTYTTLSTPDATALAALLAITFVASLALYALVETPFRRHAPSRSIATPQRAFVAGGLACIAAVAGLGAAIAAQQGWPSRQPEALSAEQIDAGRARRFALTAKKGCSLKKLDDPVVCKRERPWQVLVFGNSHEPDGYNMFAAAYGRHTDVNLISFGTLNNCEPRMEGGRPVSDVAWGACKDRVARLSDEAFVRSLDALVYSANQPYAGNKQFMWDAIAAMHHINPDLKVVVLGGYLNTKLDCAELYNRAYSFEACRDPRFVTFQPFGERETKSIKVPDLPYLYIDKARLACPGGALPSCLVTAAGEPFSYDQHHLSFGFATLLGSKMLDVYGSALASLGFPAQAPEADQKSSSN